MALEIEMVYYEPLGVFDSEGEINSRSKIMRNYSLNCLVLVVAALNSQSFGRASLGSVDLCSEIQPISKLLFNGAPNPKAQPVTLSAFQSDSRYGLPLDEVWTLLEECVRKEGHSSVSIHVKNLPGPKPLRALIRKGKDLSKSESALPLKWRVDSLNLFGEISIERFPAFTVKLKVSLLGQGADSIHSTTLPDLKKLETHAKLAASLFPRLYGKNAMDIAEVHQTVVEHLERVLFANENGSALPGHAFAFVNNLAYVEKGPLTELRNTLIGHFGFSLDDKAMDKINLTPNGSLEFQFKNASSIKIDSIVDPPGMVDRFRSWDVNSFTVLLGSSGSESMPKQRIPMVVPFSKISDQFPNLSMTIEKEIDSNLAQAYGKNMGRPDFDYLKRVFQGKETRILKGRLINPNSEVDSVNYSWANADTYLKSLEQRVEKGQRFEVGLTLLRLYQDKPNSGRFWGIVSQTWNTRFINGSGHYRDDGILFVNFDLKPGDGSLERFRIYYRFWFYKYKKDILRKRSGLPPVLVTRKQRMAEVISATLDHEAAIPPEVTFGRWDETENRYVTDPNDRGISGVDMDLLKMMRDDLLEVMQ
jgi:hypothetical protein